MSPLSARDTARLGLLAGTAIILFVFEGLAPRPLPWMRLGLGNLPVLLALLLYGPFPALAVSGVKLLIGGLLSGALAGPGFVIGGGAALASLGAMAAGRRLGRGAFSPVGLSVLGAVAHQGMQLLLAWVYIGRAELWSLLPLSLLIGLVSGFLIGLLARWSRDRLDAADPRE
ncbi:MAG: Gx transporter family protein [Candidatus Latescibacterota bacterium]